MWFLQCTPPCPAKSRLPGDTAEVSHQGAGLLKCLCQCLRLKPAASCHSWNVVVCMGVSPPLMLQACRFPVVVPLPQQRWFSRPWQLPTKVGIWVVPLVSSLTEAGVFEQLSAGFFLLPPGYSLILLQQADVAVVTDSKFQHTATFFPAKMASRTGTGREYPSCCIAVARTAAHLGSEG